MLNGLPLDSGQDTKKAVPIPKLGVRFPKMGFCYFQSGTKGRDNLTKEALCGNIPPCSKNVAKLNVPQC